jgi:DNA helicase-2/ATP-dependent DNA helicase PcrA
LPQGLENLFPEIYKQYQENLKSANALDFDDLLYLPVKLFKENKEILEAYQKRWPYLLIDEYQDTNQAQYLLTNLLVEKSQNLFVVGDPDQSIYSWRGANIKNILNFERDYPKAKVVRLEQNYRSRKTILDAANALIENNQGRYKKNLWSTRGEGEKIVLYVAGSEREEAAFVVSEIQRLNQECNIPLSEMAIFYRTNFQSRTFEDFLLRSGLPYVIVGGISFYHRREIKDILAFLHMIEGDNDYIAFSRTINLPKRGIGETSIDKIRILAKNLNLSLLELTKALVYGEEKGLRLNEKQREGLKEYLNLILDLRALAKDENVSLQKLVMEVIRKSRYLDHLREEKETYDDRKANLEELISKAVEWEGMNESSALTKFLEELSLKSQLDEADLTNERVSLMTFHNGKGLEFMGVFLVGMEEDLFPHANSRGNTEAVEEERRLCYVGMTRAKERLYLTAAETRFLWGTSRMMRPSRFLREIPREYIDRMR